MRNFINAYIGRTAFISARTLLGLIMLISAILMIGASLRESPIMDELAHIPAGYDYIRHLDYRLNPEHPPVLKALSAAPLLLLHPNFPTQNPAWATAINGQWDMGAELLYGAGNDADRIVRTARIFPIILTLLLIALIYAVGRERLGKWWALLPTVFLAFSPIVLAHGHYVTTDIAATFGILLASWRFIVLLQAPSRKNLWYAGLTLGLAELLKFSAVLLIPYFVLLAVLHFFFRKELNAWGYLKNLALVFIIGYLLVVYPVYALFTLNYPVAKQVSDTTAILTSYGGGATPEGKSCTPIRCPADLTIKMSGNKVFRPAAEYALGVLMVTQRAAGGNTAYFLGKVSARGSHWYFPVVYALKESLPALLLILGGLWLALRDMWRGLKTPWNSFRTYVRTRFFEFSLLIFTVFYWAYSINSPLNIGVRHILPTVPLMYILAVSAWRKNIMSFGLVKEEGFGSLLRSAFSSAWKSLAKITVLVFLVLWMTAETLVAYPHFLSYFNELGGGTQNGYRWITDSNYDWGQDLLELKRFLAGHPEIDRIAVDYFGGGKPSYYLGDKAESWYSAKGDPRDAGIRWLAISVNSLQGSIQPATPGFERKPEDMYLWLTAGHEKEPGLGGAPLPDFRVGTSIFVYHL